MSTSARERTALMLDLFPLFPETTQAQITEGVSGALIP